MMDHYITTFITVISSLMAVATSYIVFSLLWNAYHHSYSQLHAGSISNYPQAAAVGDELAFFEGAIKGSKIGLN